MIIVGLACEVGMAEVINSLDVRVTVDVVVSMIVETVLDIDVIVDPLSVTIDVTG